MDNKLGYSCESQDNTVGQGTARGSRYRCDYNRLFQGFRLSSSRSAAYETGDLGRGFEGSRLGREFLVGRTQRIRVGGRLSKQVKVTSGVTQGSILDPQLFLV
jgi:hypothetical protein